MLKIFIYAMLSKLFSFSSISSIFFFDLNSIFFKLRHLFNLKQAKIFKKINKTLLRYSKHIINILRTLLLAGETNFTYFVFIHFKRFASDSVEKLNKLIINYQNIKSMFQCLTFFIRIFEKGRRDDFF